MEWDLHKTDFEWDFFSSQGKVHLNTCPAAYPLPSIMRGFYSWLVVSELLVKFKTASWGCATLKY